MYKQLLSECERRLPVPVFSIWKETNFSCLCSFTLKSTRLKIYHATHIQHLSQAAGDKAGMMTEGFSEAPGVKSMFGLHWTAGAKSFPVFDHIQSSILC